MLDRIREPSVAGVAPSLRGVEVLLDDVGVSRTRRRNC